MKNSNQLKYLTVVFLLILSSGLDQIKAQSPTSTYAQSDYMKVDPLKIDEYVEIEKTLWKPLHAQRIQDGNIVGWYLFSVWSTGTSSEYNFVTITIYEGFAKMENPISENLIKRVHPKMEPAELLKQTETTRNLVKSDYWHYVYGLDLHGGNLPPPKYMEIDFMSTELNNSWDYEQMEHDIWAPIHQDRMDRNLIQAWDLWALLLNWGTGKSYNHATVISYDQFAKIEHSWEGVDLEHIHSGKNWDEILNDTDELRNLVKHELWELIDYVRVEPEAK